MTDLQVKYQTMMEQQRHNVEEERNKSREVGAREALTAQQIKQSEAEVAYGAFDAVAQIIDTILNGYSSAKKVSHQDAGDVAKIIAALL